ncbi:MAG TPA: hypothetical protein VK324_15060 [Tepidisphaeraceae bacterium]|nr:hypothetical protein [Tepidisphaeraceae bacterium]
MRRNLLHIATAISLLLGVALCVLWGRSHFARDALVFTGERKRVIAADGGALEFEAWTAFDARVIADAPGSLQIERGPAKPYAANPEVHYVKNGPTYVNWRDTTLGFAVEESEVGKSGTAHIAADGAVSFSGVTTSQTGLHYRIPLGAVAAVWFALPLVWAVSMWRRREMRRRAARGLCAGCGYDLRATTRRCPECGLVGAEPNAA